MEVGGMEAWRHGGMEAWMHGEFFASSARYVVTGINKTL